MQAVLEGVTYQYTLTTQRVYRTQRVIGQMTLPDGSNINLEFKGDEGTSAVNRHREVVLEILEQVNNVYNKALKVKSYRALENHYGFIWFLEESE